MKSFHVAVTIVMTLALGGAAHAQDRQPYPPYAGDRRGGSPAYQLGMEDGRRDGERDMMRRHNFRPEHSGNFKHADRGYQRFFGDRRYYREQYRAGFLAGYRMGYRR